MLSSSAPVVYCGKESLIYIRTAGEKFYSFLLLNKLQFMYEYYRH